MSVLRSQRTQSAPFGPMTTHEMFTSAVKRNRKHERSTTQDGCLRCMLIPFYARAARLFDSPQSPPFQTFFPPFLYNCLKSENCFYLAGVIVTWCSTNSTTSFDDIWKIQVGSVHVEHVSQPGISSGNWNGRFGWRIKTDGRMEGWRDGERCQP